MFDIARYPTYQVFLAVVLAMVAAALACARAAAGADGLVCVAGSLYLVGEARALLSAPG